MSITLRKDELMLIIEIGDITEFTGDVIVNPANTKLIMGGGVAGAIKRKGGEEIEKEATKYAPIPIGKAIATHAGKLKCKYVIHAPTVEEPGLPSSFENVYKATKAAIEEASKLGINSIAFPLMGAGVGGLTPSESIKAMVKAIEELKPKFRIHIIVRDENTFNAIINTLKELGWRS